jgi:hypothetical protein
VYVCGVDDGLGLADGDVLALGDRDSLAEGESDALADGEIEADGDRDTDADGESEGDSLALGLKLALGDRLWLADGLRLGLAEALGEILGLRLALGLRLGDSLALGETLADGDVDSLADGDVDSLADGEMLGLELADGLCDGLSLALGLVLSDGLSDGLAEALGDSDALGLNDGLALELGERDGDTLAEGLREADGETLGDGLRLWDGDVDADGECEADGLDITHLPPNAMGPPNRAALGLLVDGLRRRRRRRLRKASLRLADQGLLFRLRALESRANIGGAREHDLHRPQRAIENLQILEQVDLHFPRHHRRAQAGHALTGGEHRADPLRPRFIADAGVLEQRQRLHVLIQRDGLAHQLGRVDRRLRAVAVTPILGDPLQVHADRRLRTLTDGRNGRFGHLAEPQRQHPLAPQFNLAFRPARVVQVAHAEHPLAGSR